MPFTPIVSSGGRAATIVVAASNAHANSRAGADFVCTGVDDHIIINSVIQSLATTGGLVRLTEGTFTIGGSIVLDVDNVTLQGSGVASTTIRLADWRTTNITMVSSPNVVRRHTILRDFLLDGRRDFQTSGTHNGIVLQQRQRFEITNVHVINIRLGVGIWVGMGSRDGVISGCLTERCGSHGQHYDLLLNCRIENCHSIFNGGSGFRFTSLNSSYVGGCTAENNTGVGFYCEMNLCRLVGCLSRFNSIGFHFFSILHSSTITSNIAESCGHGMWLDGCVRHIFKGNQIQRNNGHGVNFVGSSNCIFVDNIVGENSVSSHLGFNNINIVSSLSNIIKGNIVRRGVGVARVAHGINIAVGSDGNWVVDNDLHLSGDTSSLNNLAHNTRTTSGNIL